MGGFHSAFHIKDGVSFRTGNAYFRQDFIKAFTVFSAVNIIDARTKDLHAAAMKGPGKVDGRLAAKLDNDAFRLFPVDDVQHVFQGQRFKIQTVCRIKVRGNRFRVVVDDDCFVSFFFEGPDRVYRAVVEFNALTDADWTGPENDNFLLIAGPHFVFDTVGRIVVRRFRVKFGCACIHHLVDRYNSHFLAQGADFKSRLACKKANFLIAETAFLGFLHELFRKRTFLDGLFDFYDMTDLPQEEFINLSNFVSLVDGHATAEGFSDGKEAFIIDKMNLGKNFFVTEGMEFRHIEVNQADFKGANGFEEPCFDVAFNGHDFARCLHLRAQGVVCLDKFVKRPARNLQYAVVQGRFKASRGLFRNGIFDFIKGIAGSNL